MSHTRRKWSARKGLGKKSTAPSSINSSAWSIVVCAVIITTGWLGSVAWISIKISRPDNLGSITSNSTRSWRRSRQALRPVSPWSAISISKLVASTRLIRSAVSGSSSMTNRRGLRVFCGIASLSCAIAGANRCRWSRGISSLMPYSRAVTSAIRSHQVLAVMIMGRSGRQCKMPLRTKRDKRQPSKSGVSTSAINRSMCWWRNRRKAFCAESTAWIVW